MHDGLIPTSWLCYQRRAKQCWSVYHHPAALSAHLPWLLLVLWWLQATPHSGSSQDLVPDLVRKVLVLESANSVLQSQMQQLQEQLTQHHADASKAQQQQQQQGRPMLQQDGQQQELTQQEQKQQQQTQQQQHEKQVHHLQLELQRLRQQCKVAWQQVADIKHFLNDYGLVWVGNPDPQLDHMDNPSPTAAAGSRGGFTAFDTMQTAAVEAGGVAHTALPYDISELQECLDELNQLAGDGIGQLKQINSATSSVARGPGAASGPSSSSKNKAKALQLCTPEPVKLTVYKDGLQLHKAPALTYSSATADAVLTDIFDGYFPAILKHEFPDGIPIHLVDRTSQTMAGAAAAAVARGQLSNIRDFLDLEQQPMLLPGPLAGDAFLNKLPKVVIRNQQVVPVRSAVQGYLGSGDTSGTGAGTGGRVYIRPSSSRGSSCAGNTAAPAQPADSVSTGSTSSGATSTAAVGCLAGSSCTSQQQQQQQRLATIQVKSEDGKQTYVLKLPYTATIAALRTSIDKHRASSAFICSTCQQRAQQAAAAQPVAGQVCATTLQKAAKAASAAAVTPRTQPAEGCGYEMRSTFPARAYGDAGMTLEAAGLTPSATLFMRHC